jgi:hypothetical protein
MAVLVVLLALTTWETKELTDRIPLFLGVESARLQLLVVVAELTILPAVTAVPAVVAVAVVNNLEMEQLDKEIQEVGDLSLLLTI